MRKRHYAILLLSAMAVVALAEERLAPKVEPLPDSEIDAIFKATDKGEQIPTDKLHRALISGQTYLRARAAELLGRRGDTNSVPFLIDALSDQTSYVGGGYACFGKPGQNTTRYWANESLKSISKQDFGFRWDATEAERHAAIEKWKQWYRKQKKELTIR